jgi:hypothetical protein
MLVPKTAIAAVLCAAALALISCSSNSDSVISDKASDIGVSSSQIVSQPSLSNQPNFKASVVQQAAVYKSSPGRVALSMLICRLDSSCVYTDLVEKSAKELFEIVSETAFEKNITLESLDNNYGLCDILASEKIYVSIKSNNVTSLPQSSALASSEEKASAVSDSSSSASSADSEKKAASAESSESTMPWIDKFQKAILQTGKK